MSTAEKMVVAGTRLVPLTLVEIELLRKSVLCFFDSTRACKPEGHEITISALAGLDLRLREFGIKTPQRASPSAPLRVIPRENVKVKRDCSSWHERQSTTWEQRAALIKEYVAERAAHVQDRKWFGNLARRHGHSYNNAVKLLTRNGVYIARHNLVQQGNV